MGFDLRTWLQSLSERVITDQDSEQEKLNKQLLIFASALMGFAAMVWVAIYQAMGIRFSSTVSFSYMMISAISLALYLARTNIPLVREMHGNFPLYRFIQTLLFLFVPFIMQWSIGSYISSSGRDAVGAARADRGHDLPGGAPVRAVVLRLPRADRGVRVLRLLSHRGRGRGRHDAEHRGVLRAQLRRDVEHRLPPVSATSCASAISSRSGSTSSTSS